MLWLMLLALMIAIPVLAGLYTLRELHHATAHETVAERYGVDLPADSQVAHGSDDR